MLGVALALIILGVIALFFAPWVGIPAGIVGLALLVAFLAGIGRRADRIQEPRA
jgi:protein-S-isoprenylcysteine O-methyltransferase Ste14